MRRRNASLGSRGLQAAEGLFWGLLNQRQDSFSTVNGTHLRIPEMQKALETLGFRGSLRMGSGRYRTQQPHENSINTRKDSFRDFPTLNLTRISERRFCFCCRPWTAIPLVRF